MIKAETQLVWSSDYPHWDFDLPIDDLRPAVPERDRPSATSSARNAARLFNLDPKPVKKIP